DEALSKPIIGVANTWIETMPCNFHLRALAAKVKEGIREAGGTPMELNTIAISDGITMGTAGMKASLVSREVIADSIELVCDAHLFDAVIAISGCDKTIPGTVMALCRLNVPSVMLYGGSIFPGHYKGQDVTIQEVFEAVGAHAAGRITDEELTELEDAASPGAGACGGQFTANTMAMAFEVMGISPAGFSMVPATNPRKADVAAEAGRLVMDVLKRGQRPSEIITRESLENAIAAIACSGGSTNGVLHLLAIAKEIGVGLSIYHFHPRHRRPCDPARQSRPGGMRGQARGLRAPQADRTGPGVRVRGGRDGRGHGWSDQGRGHRRDPQRGPGRRPRHARDARGHRGAGRRGSGRRRGADHRWPFLRRHARADGRPRGARIGPGRPYRDRP